MISNQTKSDIKLKNILGKGHNVYLKGMNFHKSLPYRFAAGVVKVYGIHNGFNGLNDQFS